MQLFEKIDEEKYQIAKNLYENGVLHGAKNLFLELILSNPFIWQLWFSIGAIHQREKDYIEAIKSYNIALVLDKKNANAYFHIAESFLSLNESKKASINLDLADKYCQDKNLEEKIQILKKQNKL